jgi:thiol-disulfide isomerase/thioredoxin
VTDAAPVSHVFDVDQETFEADVLQASLTTPVLVDFWASWCEPCREQLPLLERLSREHADLSVYAISFDDDRAPLDAFLAKVPVSFPILWDRAGDGLGDRLAIRRLPTTWVIDRAGVVRWVHVGFDAAEGARLAGEVSRLLAEPAPAR